MKAVLARAPERCCHAVYRPHETNRCPGCGRSQWLVGRLLAECAFCSTALPIATGQPWGCYS
jgi:hypothetical protein